jgi:hypothetical protein
MPTIITSGTESAKGFGFSATTSLGGPYFINMITFATGGPYVSVQSLAVDSSGNITAFGLNNNAVTPYYHYFWQLNSTGVLQWQRYINNAFTYGTQLQYMTVDSTGKPIISGALYNSSANDYFQAVVAQLNSTGTISWQKARQIDANAGNYMQAYMSAVDASNNVYVNARYNDSSGNNAWYMQKYNSSGTLQFAQTYPSAVTATAYSGSGVTYDAFSGNVYWNGLTSVSSATTAVLLKTDTSGTLLTQYGRKTGVTNEDLRGVEVVTDSSGNVFSLCRWSSAVGISGYYVFKYDSSGTFQWGRKFTNAIYGAVIGSIALDSSGNIYLTGFVSGATKPLLTLIKVDTSGTVVFQNSIDCTTDSGGMYTGGGKSIFIDASNNLHILSYTGTSGYGVIFKLPSNGSKTGTYSVANPSPAGTYSFTYATSTLVTMSTSNGTNVTLSDSIGGNSYQAVTNNMTSTTQTVGTSTTTTI